ncbi:Hpt domain-containing protein [Desulfogranum japonicum]|uniref:Hpt domain-containing protein n=1 Tax=Desulfogranum japonicum TaxID=231447 RepID=UPI000427A1EF|nr:Hpt domain-containing protein [Desulfogranum japonicum]
MADLQWNREFALEQTAGDEELLDELLTLFKDSAAGDLAQLVEAVAECNAEAIVASAHSLKGASSSLGIEGIREIAFQIETAARNQSLEGVPELIPLMEDLVKQVQDI